MAWTEEKIVDRFKYMIQDVKENGKLVRGKGEFLRFCEGESITAREAILAHCYQCLGYHAGPEEDRDCKEPVCPLYPFMPYSSKKRVVKSGKPMSEEHKAKMRIARDFKISPPKP